MDDSPQNLDWVHPDSRHSFFVDVVSTRDFNFHDDANLATLDCWEKAPDPLPVAQTNDFIGILYQ
jgi:hypothetical protein